MPRASRRRITFVYGSDSAASDTTFALFSARFFCNKTVRRRRRRRPLVIRFSEKRASANNVQHYKYCNPSMVAMIARRSNFPSYCAPRAYTRNRIFIRFLVCRLLNPRRIRPDAGEKLPTPCISVIYNSITKRVCAPTVLEMAKITFLSL